MHSFEKKSRLHIALCALSLLAACASPPGAGLSPAGGTAGYRLPAGTH